MKLPQVWIIDDNPIDSYVIKTMLELNNLAKEIQIFSNNDEAILKFSRHNNFKESILIITENKTEKVNGWNLIDSLSQHKSNSSFKVHMSSEYYNAQDLKKFKITDPLLSLNVKPLRLDDLKNMIKD